MNQSSEIITEEDLQAYIDGQLDPERELLVETYITNNPDAQKRVEQYSQYNTNLHALFDDTLEEEIPAQLLNHQPYKNLRPLQNAAVILLTLSLGAVIGWFGHDMTKTAFPSHYALVDDAFTSHVVYTPEIRHPVEVTRDQDKHLMAWLSKRLKTQVKAPSLSSMGFDLLGGRLLGTEGEPAAQFMYQNSGGQRLTLFLRHKMGAESETA